MTIGDAINRVKELYAEKEETNSYLLPTKYIYNKLLTVREKVILQRRFISVNPADLQPIHAINMSPIYDKKGTRLMKSINPIPEFIGSRINKSMLISSESGNVTFSRTTFEDYRRLVGNKYASNLEHYYIYDNYLYLVNTRIESVVANSIWRDPIIAYRLSMTNQGLQNCINNTDINFFTPFVEDVINITVKELLGPILQEEKNVSLP